MHHVGLECNFLKWTPCACLESLAGRQEAGTDVVERCLCLPFGEGDPSSDPDEARDEVGLSGLTPSTEARRARCLRVSLATATAAPTAPVARSASLRRMRGRGEQRIGASFAFAQQCTHTLFRKRRIPEGNAEPQERGGMVSPAPQRIQV